jgi:hypothetical protein
MNDLIAIIHLFLQAPLNCASCMLSELDEEEVFQERELEREDEEGKNDANPFRFRMRTDCW